MLRSGEADTPWERAPKTSLEHAEEEARDEAEGAINPWTGRFRYALLPRAAPRGKCGVGKGKLRTAVCHGTGHRWTCRWAYRTVWA